MGSLVASVPLSILRDAVQPFAGKETVIDANVSLALTASLSVAVNIVQQWKLRGQRQELKRLRKRIDDHGWETPGTT